jgi:hypothetical protein
MPIQKSLSRSVLVGLLETIAPDSIVFRLKGRGDSMLPTLRSGDAITIQPLCGRLPSVGDIVAVSPSSGGSLTVHRIVCRNVHGWVTRGDNGIETDPAVSTEQILGRVTEIRRNGRRQRFGLGLERLLIARLSRAGLFRPMTGAAARVKKRLSNIVAAS